MQERVMQDYVEAMLILQQKKADDYVATGKQHSVRYVINTCSKKLKIKIKWIGKGVNERAVVKEFDKKITPFLKKNQIILKNNKKYFRPSEVSSLLGDPRKAMRKLNWKPTYDFKSLIHEMLECDLKYF